MCSLVLPVAVRGAHTTCPAVSAIGMMAVVEREEDLHEIVPDGVFGNESVMSLGLFDDGGEVAASTEFHEDVQNACIAVNVSVVIAYNVFVMEVLEDVARRGRVGAVSSGTNMRNAHFRNNLFAIALCHALKVEFLAREDL